MSDTTLPVLATNKVDVQAIWKRHGFVPTTDDERAERQRKNPHAEQCLCRFCQAERKS
jgi:hypothetical protein